MFEYKHSKLCIATGPCTDHFEHFLGEDTNGGKSNSFWLKLLPSCIMSCYMGPHEAFCQVHRSDNRCVSGISPNDSRRRSTPPLARRKRTRPDSSISWTCITSSRAHEPVAGNLDGTRHSNASSHRADKADKTASSKATVKTSRTTSPPIWTLTKLVGDGCR